MSDGSSVDNDLEEQDEENEGKEDDSKQGCKLF